MKHSIASVVRDFLTDRQKSYYRHHCNIIYNTASSLRIEVTLNTRTIMGIGSTALKVNKGLDEKEQ